MIIPAWTALSYKHHMGVEHFLDLTKNSPLVPPDRARMTAQPVYWRVAHQHLSPVRSTDAVLTLQYHHAYEKTLTYSDIHWFAVGR